MSNLLANYDNTVIYKILNKEKTIMKSIILEQSKKYVEENKDKIKKNKDEWYIKNKEKILVKLKQTFICECGSEVRCAGKTEHNRSIKHNLYIESISES